MTKQLKLKTDVNGATIVGAIYAHDMCSYETTLYQHDFIWRPVERYKTLDKAIAGHYKWIKILLKNPQVDVSAQSDQMMKEWSALPQESKDYYVMDRILRSLDG